MTQRDHDHTGVTDEHDKHDHSLDHHHHMAGEDAIIIYHQHADGALQHTHTKPYDDDPYPEESGVWGPSLHPEGVG